MSEKDDNRASILSTLSDIENSGFDMLLQQLFVQLKVPYPCPIPCCPMAQPVLILDMFFCYAISCPNLWFKCRKVQKGSGPDHLSASVLTHIAARKLRLTSWAGPQACRQNRHSYIRVTVQTNVKHAGHDSDNCCRRESLNLHVFTLQSVRSNHKWHELQLGSFWLLHKDALKGTSSFFLFERKKKFFLFSFLFFGYNTSFLS